MDELDLIAAIQDTANRQADVAALYRQALLSADKSFDWPMVDAAIVERWSASGLRTIKRLAWESPAE